MKLVFYYFFILSTSLFAQIEYSNGYNSNTTKQNVISIFESMNNKTIRIKNNSITVLVNGKFNEFMFCKNKLIFYRCSYTASMRNFIKLFDELSKRFGNNVYAFSWIKLFPLGELSSFTVIWQSGDLQVSLVYDIFPENDDLSIKYDLQNDCSKQ